MDEEEKGATTMLDSKDDYEEPLYNEIVDLFDRYGEEQFEDVWIIGRVNNKEYAEENRLSAVISYLQKHKYNYNVSHRNC